MGKTAAGLFARGRVSRTSLVAPPDAPATLNAVHSQKVVNSFGICLSPDADNYSNEDAVRARLVEIGAKHFRTRIYPGTHPKNDFHYSLYTQNGLRWHCTSGSYRHVETEDQRLEQWRATYPNLLNVAAALSGIGGYNEPNGPQNSYINPDWSTIAAAHQQRVWALRDSNPSLSHVQVCSPSLHDNPPGGSAQLQLDYLALSKCVPYIDRVEMHRYPAGRVPSTGIDQRTAWAVEGMGADKTPILVSETGYNVAPPESEWVSRVTMDVAATYAPRMLMEHVTRGNRVYFYELLRQDDPTGMDVQDWYGMVAPDLVTLDPSALAMKRMLALLEDGDTAFIPQPLAIEISGHQSIQWYLTGKRNGSYKLIGWRDVSVWTKSTKTPMNPTPVTGTLKFPVDRAISWTYPKISDVPTTSSSKKVHSVPVAGDLVIVNIG